MQTLINGPDITHQAQLPLTQIVPSITNPRKTLDQTAMDELVGSIKKVGVLQPILVRTTGSPQIYEIVAGERRYRAADKAGLETIPAVIRDLTDLEAMELQVLENLHRTDLHPLEEAEGFQQLLDANGYTVPTLAHRLGKSKATIYASLKLCALCDKARQAFYEGKLTASTALLIARIPGEKLQQQALKEITTDEWNGEMPSYREAMQTIHNKYTLDLTRAIFDIDDADLVEEAGDCSSCPKRSGNAREIFSDIKSADVCTDTECFQQKRQAHIDHVKVLPTSITGDDAKRIMPYSYSFPQTNDYAYPHRLCGDKTWTELLGDELPTRTVIHDGMKDPVVLVDVIAATQLLEKKGIQVEPEPEKEETLTPYQIEHRERTAARKAEQERRVALFASLHSRLADGAVLKKLLAMAIPLMIADFFDRLNPDETALFFEARGEEDWLPEDYEERIDRISELFNKDQSRLLIELFAVSDGDGVLDPGYYWNSDGSRERALDVFKAILTAAGIDPGDPKTATDTTSAAHAEEEIAREDNSAAALADGTEADPEEDHIQAPAIAAASQGAAKPLAAGGAEVRS